MNCACFCREVTVQAFRLSDEFNPRVALRVAFDDFRRPIRRTIVDDDPPLGQLGLSDDRTNGSFDESLFVFGGGYMDGLVEGGYEFSHGEVVVKLSPCKVSNI